MVETSCVTLSSVSGRPHRTRTAVVLAGPDRDFLEAVRDAVDARPPFEVVAIAPTEEEAIEAAESLEPSIVLVEAAAAGQRSETIQRLRTLESRPSVVLVTSAPQNGSAPDFDSGADAYVQKDLGLAPIIDVVLAFAANRRSG